MAATQPALALEVRGLRKTYGDLVAVDDLDLTVRRGEIFGLIGPNGSGKTTTVECLQGLRRCDSGSINVLGCDPVRDRSILRAKVGSQLQDSALPDRIKVWEALDLFAALSPKTADCSRLIDEWGLTAKRNAAFADLSGGQRQRLFIALALVNGPELVFLDEMTTGLDPGARRVAWGLIDDIRARGTTVVLVTHFMDEAEHLCDRVAVLKAGHVVACDTPAGLIAANDSEATVTFTTDATALDWLPCVPGVTGDHRLQRSSLTSSADRARRHPQTDTRWTDVSRIRAGPVDGVGHDGPRTGSVCRATVEAARCCEERNDRAPDASLPPVLHQGQLAMLRDGPSVPSVPAAQTSKR